MATRKAKSTATTFSFVTLNTKGIPTTTTKPVSTYTAEQMVEFGNASDALNEHFVGCLLAGIKPVFASPVDFNEYLIKTTGEKINRKVSKQNALRLVLTSVASIRELSDKPLQSLWDTFTTNKIAEIAEVKKQNLVLVANGEKAKTLPRITEPNLNALLDMLKPQTEVDHLVSAIKSMKTAYNHFLELKGKQAQTDSEKLKALIISNGGEV
jgi:hypothetical protein